MIEGVKIQITTEELHSHILKKIDYHKEKHLFYKNQAEGLEKGVEEDPHGSGSNLSNYSNNPLDSLKNSAKKHQQRVDYFRFIADHLVPKETYELTENDLIKLEVISGSFF